MRFIPRPQPPPAAWQVRADSALSELRAAPDAAARAVIIDRLDTIWGDLKPWLLSLSHGKCWFTESKDCFSYFDVEHYRPKRFATDLDGTVHAGYWWLTFNWLNFRICGNVGNTKKGTYFPLRSGNARIPVDGDVRLEDPQILDPADAHDPTLLSFTFEGNAIPAAHVTDEWERDRVSYSVTRLNLDFGPLVDRRKVVWNECWTRIKEYRHELALCRADAANSVARSAARTCVRELRELLRDDRELSAVARACMESLNDPQILAVLRSM